MEENTHRQFLQQKFTLLNMLAVSASMIDFSYFVKTWLQVVSAMTGDSLFDHQKLVLMLYPLIKNYLRTSDPA